MKIKKANSYAMHALMYMVRHMTQLPVSIQTIAKAEQIPYRRLVDIFHLLTEAGMVTTSKLDSSCYEFAKSPSEITLMELFELVEGEPIFDECFMNHCDCGSENQDCRIYATWRKATAAVARQLSESSIEMAAWGHPEHYFQDTQRTDEQSE